MYDYLVIDTYAIISFLRKEENHLTIKRIFEEARISKTTILFYLLEYFHLDIHQK